MCGGGGGGISSGCERKGSTMYVVVYLTEAGQEWPLAVCRRCATAGVMAMRYSDRD